MSNFKTTLDHFELPADTKADNYRVIQRSNKGLYNLFVLCLFGSRVMQQNGEVIVIVGEVIVIVGEVIVIVIVGEVIVIVILIGCLNFSSNSNSNKLFKYIT